MGKKRVLVWGLSNNRAGTERVIRTYVQHAPNCSFDFLCYENPANHADLFEGTDNRYFVIPVKINHPIANWIALRRFMREHAHEYSTLWFNVNEISNIDLLKLAYDYGIPKRATHMHNPSFPDVWITKLFSQLNWKTCLRLSTDYWACSKESGAFLFKGAPFQVITNFVDGDACAFDSVKREEVRARYDVSESTKLIGTVGRLAPQKNQRLLIKVLPGVLEKMPNASLMLVGEGELRDELTALASKLKVSDHVIFAGSQSDVRAYLSAFDVFAFPSVFEGLGISLLEAQFNLLPCVVSEAIPEAARISSSFKKVSLADEEGWVDALLSASRKESYLEKQSQQYDISNIGHVVERMFK